MSGIAASRSPASARPWTYSAVAFAVAAPVVWVLAGIVDDGLYAVTGILGIVAFVLGLKARREAIRLGTRRWPATAAIAVGGLLGSAVLVATIVVGISHAF